MSTKIIKSSQERKNEKQFSFFEMVYIFALCSIIGYFVEIGYVYLAVGKIVSRGMLYGPYCPIYGFGGIILYMLFYNLKREKQYIIYAFVTASIVLGSFELICGLGFKYIFNIEMWNYEGHFLEILNYTTVPILIGWGILGTIYVFLIQPILLKIISFLPKHLEKRLAVIIICIFVCDFALSLYDVLNNTEILYKMVHPEMN